MRQSIVTFAGFAIAALAFVPAIPGQHLAHADGVSTKPVVELFTSQGCSSCPPADALLGRLADRDDVIALSFNVDYWDYIGWKDTLARHEFTERQRKYAKKPGFGRVYTPQMVINGMTHVVGSNEAAVEQAVSQTSKSVAAKRVAVEVGVEAGEIVVKVSPSVIGTAPPEGAQLWLATVQKRAKVQIARGENRGKTVEYRNVVRDFRAIGTWQGKPAEFRFKPPHPMKPGAEMCVVVLQERNQGAIIGAAELKTW